MIEKYYGKAFRGTLAIINPVKKRVKSTECIVHKFINEIALNLLNTNEYRKEYKVLFKYFESFNKGAVWVDQDFNSINHFYNPYKKRGIYGHKDAMILSKNYYEKAKKAFFINDFEEAFFYLGATCHLIQDLTVPQHVNLNLLEGHSSYENYVRKTYDIIYDFVTTNKPIVFNEIEEYVNYNSMKTIKTHDRYKDIESKDKRNYKIALRGLPLAQETTAGVILMFLKNKED